VHQHAQDICTALKLDFSFPATEKRRHPAGRRPKFSLLDVPDVLLTAAVVFATKYVAPLDGLERFPQDAGDPLVLKMDWAVWEAKFLSPERKQRDVVDFENLDPEEVWSMSKEEINDYLDWFQETQIDRNPTCRHTFLHAAPGKANRS